MGFQVCKKKSYRDKESALGNLHFIQSRQDGRKKPIRVYPCDLCGKWHLTSKDNSGVKKTTSSLKGNILLIKELLSAKGISFTRSQIEHYIKIFNNYEMAIGLRYQFIIVDKEELDKFISCIKQTA